MDHTWDAFSQLDRYRTVMHQTGAAAQASGIELERRKMPRPTRPCSADSEVVSEADGEG